MVLSQSQDRLVIISEELFLRLAFATAPRPLTRWGAVKVVGRWVAAATRRAYVREMAK